MKIGSLKLVYFSPTGTTGKIVENIAAGMQVSDITRINVTPYAAAVPEYEELADGMAIIGAPVYGGRLALEAVNRLKRVKAGGIPTVVVAVYGNRAYEDALLELKNLAEEQGFRPVAGGAFVGEHSFSTAATPIASGRPDDADIALVRDFGAKVMALLSGVDSTDRLLPCEVPGKFPHKERREAVRVAPFVDEQLCTKCEACIPACPTGSIVMQGVPVINAATCIRCAACVKLCPFQALYFVDPGAKHLAETLARDCSTRKEPETYLSSPG